MTGYDVLKRALILTGYSGTVGNPSNEAAFSLRAEEIIKQLSTELKIPEILSMSEDMNLSDKKSDALCYGVAMLLSFTEGDSGKNKLLTDIYNAKRAVALGEITSVADRLPTVGEVGG